MDPNDSWHIVIRPMSDNIGDLRTFMAEELRLPKSYIKYVKRVNPFIADSFKIDNDLHLGNLLYNRKDRDEK